MKNEPLELPTLTILHKQKKVTIGDTTYPWKGDKFELLLTYDVMVSKFKTGYQRLHDKLRLICEQYKCELKDVLDGFASSPLIRLKHIMEELHVPLHVAQQIMSICRQDRDAFVKYAGGIRKTKNYAEFLALEIIPIETQATTEHRKKVFFMPPEYGEGETWEGELDIEDGLAWMEEQRASIVKSIVIKEKKRKMFLLIADKYIKEKKERDKATKPKVSEKERMDNIIEKDAKEAEAFDEEEEVREKEMRGKKKKKFSKKDIESVAPLKFDAKEAARVRQAEQRAEAAEKKTHGNGKKTQRDEYSDE